MFCSPEEINNMPGVGFVEGMACGCAYFGLNDPMYADLKMKPGIHYISHDGTIDDLIEKVKFYQKNQEKLEKIAAKGYRFVTENLNPEIVAKRFFSDLENFSVSKNSELRCSFTK
jgi:glycosyltransferase involved in cell wall biosynthesis